MFKNYPQKLIEEAKKAMDFGEVPVSAIAVQEGKIIATAINEVEKQKNKIAHAEIVLLQNLHKILQTTHFFGMNISVFVSLEPCCMCVSAFAMCGIENIYYLLEDEKFGGVGKVFNGTAYFKPNFYLLYSWEYEDMLKKFFLQRR